VGEKKNTVLVTTAVFFGYHFLSVALAVLMRSIWHIVTVVVVVRISLRQLFLLLATGGLGLLSDYILNSK
jgi:hypothetical protein